MARVTDSLVKVDEIIKNALNCDHIQSMAIEYFTKKELIELSEQAKKQGLLITLRAEHSNVHQGVLVNVVKKQFADQFLEYL
ncbi:hypothetical protein LY28_03723 [Ruminiclostridium sufflavum DSM 19573]|uniref:Uncharacterized protein n=1 Tax=Ruminiclostridium sufflavum DSM 19573 TaxID=1121337 RepID=A0A318XHD0_9FIRM|nr:hypothetical protein [Ruminiclostridium sufflavum]PYG84271.1 hypothetical protein LY28_03723 [Ruminiclostridium sufflavum DSM 19573]